MQTNNTTWAGMIALNLAYHVYCSHCDRHVELDMTKMPPEEKAIGRIFRCKTCDWPGSSTVTHRSANHSYPGAKALGTLSS